MAMSDLERNRTYWPAETPEEDDLMIDEPDAQRAIWEAAFLRRLFAAELEAESGANAILLVQT